MHWEGRQTRCGCVRAWAGKETAHSAPSQLACMLSQPRCSAALQGHGPHAIPRQPGASPGAKPATTARFLRLSSSNTMPSGRSSVVTTSWLGWGRICGEGQGRRQQTQAPQRWANQEDWRAWRRCAQLRRGTHLTATSKALRSAKVNVAGWYAAVACGGGVEGNPPRWSKAYGPERWVRLPRQRRVCTAAAGKTPPRPATRPERPLAQAGHSWGHVLTQLAWRTATHRRHATS